MEEAKLNLEPMIISKLSSDLFFSLVLCSNSASSEKVESFSDLRNKSILVQGGKFKRLTELWLDLLCLQVGEKDKYKFFNKIEFVEKPMQAVLPVFFNKTDLCIVNNVALDAIIDLNPQIKKSLKVIFKRDNLINEMTFVRKDLDKNAKEIIKSRGLNYKSLPNGEQIFKIFKSFDSAVFKPSDLDGVKSLFKEYQRLKSSTKN